jgi:hypothetical protein
MKNAFIILLLICSTRSNAQLYSMSFGNIDWKVQDIDAAMPDTLAYKLTTSLHTDLEKTRAIFSWIVQHISYNTSIFNHGRNFIFSSDKETWDTASVWKSGDEMTAIKVLHRRVAVCDGYAKLFKTLCDYAGIQSVVITGYARCRMEKNEKFRTNHSWNAVLIDNEWRLLDVTWASGYINSADEFVRHPDETYFLTPPRQFIRDHYPEDQRWTLLENAPVLSEFRQTPFRCKSYVKYGIHSVFPSRGLIEAAVGDTVNIVLMVNDAFKNRQISSDPFFDSAMLYVPATAFLKPADMSEKIIYHYVVPPDPAEWLNIIYNDDMVLRYRLDVKRK